jgi:hypothetical protein
MNPVRFSFWLLLLLLLGSSASASEMPVTQSAPPQRVLFVGNSFSFYNNGLHTHVRNFLQAAQAHPDIQFAQKLSTISNARLEDQEPGLPALLQSFKPDVVILQGHSLEAIDPKRSASFRESATQLTSLVRSANATPMFFMTWAYTGQPEMTAKLADAYKSIGQELDVRVLPVGLAFQQAELEIPGLQLRIADLKHPSLAGSYLAAAVIYSALYGESPINLEYTAGLPEELARQLRDLAWRITSNFSIR